MIRYLILLIFFKSILFGCSLCSVYSPKTHVSVSIKADKQYIKHAKVKWQFAEAFTTELLQLYDTNLDATFDKAELEIIQEALLAYIEPKNYLTFVSYDTKINEESRKLDIKKREFIFKGGVLYFEYEFDLNYKIIDKNKLYFEVYDDEGYFIMIANQKKMLLSIPYKIKKELDYNSATFTIDAPALANAKVEEKVDEKPQEENKVLKRKENLVEQSFEDEETVKKEETMLESFVKKVKKYLVDIERGEDKYALFFLLLASFVYGIIHALGPGHGKALAFSYFSAQKSSYMQAFGISLATAFVHIVGALILVVISIFILQSVLNSFLDDSITYITQTSAVLIMLLSIFILYRKLKKKSCVCSACATHEDKPMFSTSAQNGMSFVKPSNTQIHFTNNRKKQDLFFVVTAGLIPCPGTVVLFVYAFILKTYFSVILASIAISLGMGLVIFASSFLGVSLNKVSAKSHKIVNIVEILAPIVMFGLGLMLLLNANIL